mgnify:CR=1 FL=1
MLRHLKTSRYWRVGNWQILLIGREQLKGKTRQIGRALSSWLTMAMSMWFGASLAVRAVLWLALGIILARELALPPYLTWLLASCWWGISAVRLFAGDRRIGRTHLMVLVMLIGAASFSVYWWSMETSLGHLADASEPITALGQIIDISYKTPFQRSLVVSLQGILLEEETWPKKGRVLITQVALPGETNDEELMIGDQVVVTGQFRRPRRATNPGQFDYCHHLYRRGISLTAYIEEASGIRKIGGTGDEQPLLWNMEGDSPAIAHQDPYGWLWLRRQAQLFRHRLVASWEGHLPARYHGLFGAMVLGERNLLDAEVQDAFRGTGQAHLLSVSGLHIGFVVGGVWLLIRPLPCGELFKYVLTILVAWLYALIAGGNPPVVRAAITLSLYFMALACGRGHDPLVATGWAALIQLFVNPSLLFDVSFQLSYGALLGILALAPVLQGWFSSRIRGNTLRHRLVARILDLMIISISAQLAILPLLAYYFHEVSWIGPILGLITVPLAGVIVPLGLLSSLLGLIVGSPSHLAPFLGAMLVVLDELTAWGATWSWARIYLAAGQVVRWVVYYIAVSYIMQYVVRRTLSTWLGIARGGAGRRRTRTWLWWGLILTLFVVYFPLVAPLWRPLEITFLDVGQGDAIFIATPSGRNILIDGGGLPPSRAGSSYDIGKDIVLSFLRHRGVRKLDLVVATHFHNDHTQGLAAVLRELPVDLLGDNGRLDAGFASIQYRRLLEELAMDRVTRREVLKRGHYISLSPKLELTVLHPSRDAGGNELCHDQIIDQNNNSVVIKLRTPYYSLLFTGDIDKVAQMELVRKHLSLENLDDRPEQVQSELGKKHSKTSKGPLGGRASGGPKVFRTGQEASLHDRFGITADLLKIPHHGSREALVYSFLGAASPQETVISVGGNPFGHPVPEFLYALELVTGKLPWRTDLVGSIRVMICGRYLRIEPYNSQPFWRIGNWPTIQGWESTIRYMLGRV